MGIGGVWARLGLVTEGRERTRASKTGTTPEVMLRRIFVLLCDGIPDSFGPEQDDTS
jgi:hypothetical protein